MKLAFHKDARGQFYNQEGNPLTAEQVQDFVNTAYAKIGVMFSGVDLKSEADGWYVGVDDNDPEKFHWFFAYKNTPFGRKVFAVGHDGSTAAKREMLEFKRDVLFDRSLHVWGEFSGRMADLMQSWGAPKVPFEIAKMLLPGKQLQQVDEYSYIRPISGKPITKTIYGFPKVPHSASWRSPLLVSEGRGRVAVRKFRTFEEARRAAPMCLVGGDIFDAATNMFGLRLGAQTELDMYESREDGCISDSEAKQVRAYLSRLP